MSSKYGATDEMTVQNAEEADVEIDLSGATRRRQWWREHQHILYGLGHIHNDLCAAMWFSYMMLFFQAVLEMRSAVAGQIVDAIATPIVGIMADKYGTKKSWHLTGSILVSCTFPMLFVRCWGCYIGGDPDYLSWWMPLYYAVLITFFQIGWAIVQISHLAMIPMTASIAVYLITWVVLRATNYSTYIGPSDDYKLRDVALIVTGIGVTAFTLFHMLFKLRIPNKKGNDHTITNGTPSLLTCDEQDTELQKDELVPNSKIYHFLRMPLLYQTSLLYVFSRLYWALTLVYVPLFLEERLSVNPSAGSELVASVPLVLYISSFFSSLLLKSKISLCGNQLAYIIGSCLSFISCLWIALGAGSSTTLVSSLCVTADLIGPHSHQGAAIYSIVTFADKLVTGIAVVAIENYKCRNAADCPEYYRGVLTYACGGSAVLGIVSLILTRITSRRKILS
ncbi:hypothetical protein MSG28_011036 [Choristoneura fumiferana]|uniref:Uncharacterized protein n=2 Tax=Choristoneura fumiferana TaxID=7141 RepID=A0ACC0KPX9_CHOFU|nr:hypothetical protein MSG28_011036 [Choristoneura fumiferana]KAI8438589.1 hypothetical protein MSG28_011036 [Choristoneura fumiferana]